MSAEVLRFIALGDSTTVGVGDPAPGGTWRGWARLLASALAENHEVAHTNLAVTGATAATVRDLQLGPAVDAAPHLASLIVGVNDTMRSSWEPMRVRDDILTCVGTLAAAGAVVLTVRFHDHGAVFGLPGVVRRPLWRRIELLNAAYDEAHLLFGGLRVDLAVESWVYERRFWSVDRLHPSPLGHGRLAHEFARGLRGLGYAVPPMDLAGPGNQVSHRVRDFLWLATEGAPWLGRRAHDLLPWAARMLSDEATTRVGRFMPGHAAATIVADAGLPTRGQVVPPPTDAASA